MKRIHLSDLESQYKIQQYRDLYDKVRELIALNEIKPVKAAGINGKKPALYNEYWIISKQEDVSNYIEELSYNYVPMISTNYYLNHIQQYIEDRVWLLYLNQSLKTQVCVLKEIIKRIFQRIYKPQKPCVFGVFLCWCHILSGNNLGASDFGV